MPKWKLLFEVGGSDEPSVEKVAAPQGPSAEDLTQRQAAWSVLVDARHKLNAAITAGNTTQRDEILQWVGGGLATLAAATGDDARALLKSLDRDVPLAQLAIKGLPPRSGGANPTQDGEPYFRLDENYVPPPKHPGAPRKLDYESLTPEEREAIGVIAKDQIGTDVEVEVVEAQSTL